MPDRKPYSGAQRMDFRTHIDDTLLSMKTDELDEQNGDTEVDAEAMQKLNEIAALKDHPGWNRITELLEQKIKDYRAGTPLEDLINNADMSDQRFGQLMRSCIMVAKELESVLGFVNVAAAAVEDEKTRKREERKRDEAGRYK